MGFYGNITNTNRTQFVFDKTFANRAEMDGWIRAEKNDNGTVEWIESQTAEEAQELVDNDDVFIGRYVLVDYDKEALVDIPYRRVYADADKKYFYFSKDLNSNTIVRSFKDSDETYYIEDDDGNYIINPKAEDEAYFYHVFRDEIIYIYENNEYKFYQVSGVTSKYITGLGALYDVAVLKEVELDENNTALDSYYSNYFQDRKIYKTLQTGVGRGWDSTVWQKTFSEGKAKYVMVAELNSVVPTFDLTVDQPTIEPISPHFDADSTNVYYRLHVQPSWGFKIKEANENSDEEIDYKAIQNLNNDIIESYNGDIYYNKDGFDSDYHYDKEKIPDSINISLGSSGTKYNTISNHNDTNVYEKQPCEDTQELSIHLSSLGDSVSAIWDIIYGTGKETVSENTDKKYRRNKDVSWDSLAGLRLVTSDPTSNGFLYLPERTETVAGCINSVHDLMGMIIVDDENSELDIKDALTNRIYYRNGSYYIKDRQDELIENGSNSEGFTLSNFPANLYYKSKNNYYLENESTYEIGNIYYKINENEHIVVQNLSDYIYEPNKYSYLENGSYLIEEKEEPINAREYYLIEDLKNEQSALQVSNQWRTKNAKLFRPDQFTYAVFNELFGDLTPPTEEKIIDGATYIVGNSKGLFYTKTDNDKIGYVRFDYDNPPSELISNLYYIENYYEAWSAEDGKYVPIAADIGGYEVVISDPIPIITFKENTFYYEDDSGLHLVGFNENGKIDIGPEDVRADSYKIYVTLNDTEGTYTTTLVANEETPFYIANNYYYKDNADYILDLNIIKTEGITYYKFINNPTELVASEKYYKPNKYYYLHTSGNYILDTNDTVTEDREYYYYPPNQRYVIEGNGIYATGSVWNESIIPVPDGVKLGTKAEAYTWKELVGFARSLNTIHGLILKINNILKSDDAITRDTTTVQGCINTINDIIKKFDELKPGEVMIVNNSGQMTSAESNGDDWIAVSVNPAEATISLTHTGPVEGAPVVIDNEEPSFGETFTITDWQYDNRGHKYGETSHTVKIPQGSYTDSDSINGQKVITKIEFEPSTGAITSTSSDLVAIEIAENETLGSYLSSLHEDINQEAKDREATIVAEAEARINADNTEEQARISADNLEAQTRAEAISVEAQTREAKDNELATSITALSNSTTTTVNSLSGRIENLENRVSDWNAAEQNVQSDWNESDQASDAYILNKPDLSKVVQTTTEFSYNYNGSTNSLTIQDLLDYIATLEVRIKVLEDNNTIIE